MGLGRGERASQVLGKGVSGAGAVGVGAVAFFLLVVVEFAFRHGRLLDLDMSTYVARLSVLYSLVGTALVGGLVWARSRLMRLHSRGEWACGLLVVALVWWPAHDQARFLTAGDGVSAHVWVALIRVAITILLVVMALVCWIWLTRGLATAGSRNLRHSRIATAVWLIFGLMVAASTGWVVVTKLAFYAHAALFVVGLCWLALASVLGALVRIWAAPNWLGMIFLLTLAGHGLLVEESGRGQVLLVSRIADAANRMLSGDGEGPDYARLDIAGTRVFSCPSEERIPERPLRLASDQRKNVIILSVDALRRDMLDERRAGIPVMANVMKFASHSLDFKSAISSYPATIFALGGAFTGMSPSRLLYAPSMPTSVFSRIQHRFDRNLVILPHNKWFRKKIIDSLFVQGVKRKYVRADASDTTSAVIEELRRARNTNSTAMIWAHYLEPHHPYRRHEDPQLWPGERGAYFSEVSYLDRNMKRLFEELQVGGWLDDSLIILMSDHGEALGERGYVGHHVYLDAWLTDVPLIVHYPGVEAGTVIEPVALTDLTATIHHFLDLPAPQGVSSLSWIGEERHERIVSEAFPARGSRLFSLVNKKDRSVAALMARAEMVQSSANASYEPKVSLVEGRYRLIVGRKTGVVELYDRIDDPRQEINLVHQLPEMVAAMKVNLGDWHAQQSLLIRCEFEEGTDKLFDGDEH